MPTSLAMARWVVSIDNPVEDDISRSGNRACPRRRQMTSCMYTAASRTDVCSLRSIRSVSHRSGGYMLFDFASVLSRIMLILVRRIVGELDVGIGVPCSLTFVYDLRDDGQVVLLLVGRESSAIAVLCPILP